MMTNDCENIISKTGWGLCHYFIIGLCGVCALTEACVLPVMLVIVPLLVCDLGLTTGHSITIHAALTLGMAIGAFLFGIIIDAYGRKGSISITMITVFCAMITLSFAQTTFLINLAVFTLGIGLAGNSVVLNVYLIELLPMEQRGSCLAVLDIFAIIGYTLALGFSTLLMPSIIRLQNKKFRPSSWRVLTGIGGIPNLIMACGVSLLPPSPRYMLYRRQREEALAILQQMYAINTSKHANTCLLNNLDNCVRPEEEDDTVNHNFLRTTQKFCLKTCNRVRELFESRFRRTTILGIFLTCLQFPGVTWFTLWNTQLLEDMENLSNSTKQGSTCAIDIQNLTTGFFHNCQEADTDRFKLLLYPSLSYVLAEILLVIGIDVVSRKVFLVFSGLIGAASCIGLVFTVHKITRIVLSMTILAMYAICRTSTTIIILENYFTGLRGTVIGLSRVFPYLLGSIMKPFLNIYCLPTILFISGMLLSAAVAGSRMPDLTRLPMQE